MAIPPQFLKHQAGKGKPTPSKSKKPASKGNPALDALKAAKPQPKGMAADDNEPC